jgi:N-acetylglucosaminyl-diphospho-decaprenol L-rhamnosyltransferase
MMPQRPMVPRVAIVVVSWNTRAELAACLASMESEVGSGRASVVVVDNASSDGSAALVRESFPWATLVEAGTNLGFGPAINLGAAASDAAWVAAANADIELTPGALAALLAAGEADAQAGIVAPRLVLGDGSTQHSVHPFPTLSLALAFNLGLLRPLRDRFALENGWDPDRERVVDWAIGAFVVIRRRAFEQAGGFDAGQWMYAEDLDLAWRVARAGWHTRYVPAAVVRHVGAAATDQAWGPARRERWLASTYGWMIRRRGPLVTRAYALVSCLGATVRWAFFPSQRDEMAFWARAHGGALVRSRARLERQR